MVAAVREVRPRTKDLYERMAGGVLYREAAELGMNLSTYLEEVDPAAEYDDGLDSFSRMVKLANIRINQVPERGLYADEFGEFDKSDSARALVPEWIARQVRAVRYGQRPDMSAWSRLRAIFMSDQFPLNGLMRPYADDPTPIVQQVTPQIPLAQLVARSTGIRGDAYRAFYLTRVTADLRMARVAEAAEIPRSKLTGGEHLIRLYKYGRALETSYEQLRRMQIDLVAFYIQLLAVQAEVDRVASALDILVNGDGNAGTAPVVYTQTGLHPGSTAGTMTLPGWLAFKMKFKNPYSLTTGLAQEAVMLQAMLLSTGSGNIPLVVIQAPSGFGSFTPINPGLRDNVAIGWMAEAPTLKFVGFDNRMALEHVTEVGGDISEIERFVLRQTQALTMTTVDGFRILDGNAVAIYDVNA